MVNKNFFNIQTNLTAVKIVFFEKYISIFLRIILLQFGECFIADLFSGPGKNGDKDGSPIILIKKIVDILKDKTLLKKFPFPKITILFNDNNQSYILSLKDALIKLHLPKNIDITESTNKDFKEILDEKQNKLILMKIPKFFFLDPFGYSDIEMKHIETLMNFKFTEVMIFIPTSHIYRFANFKNISGKSKQFLENFTMDGPGKYKDINEFIESIRQKILKSINLTFVRAIPLVDGKKINTLFFLTKHIKGMNLANEIFWKLSDDGKSINFKKYSDKKNKLTLFNPDDTGEFQDYFFNKFIKFLNEKKIISNIEIIEFAVKEGARLKFAKDVLDNLSKEGKININYLYKQKSKGYYISAKYYKQKFCEINYLQD